MTRDPRPCWTGWATWCCFGCGCLLCFGAFRAFPAAPSLAASAWILVVVVVVVDDGIYSFAASDAEHNDNCFLSFVRHPWCSRNNRLCAGNRSLHRARIRGLCLHSTSKPASNATTCGDTGASLRGQTLVLEVEQRWSVSVGICGWNRKWIFCVLEQQELMMVMVMMITPWLLVPASNELSAATMAVSASSPRKWFGAASGHRRGDLAGSSPADCPWATFPSNFQCLLGVSANPRSRSISSSHWGGSPAMGSWSAVWWFGHRTRSSKGSRPGS